MFNKLQLLPGLFQAGFDLPAFGDVTVYQHSAGHPAVMGENRRAAICNNALPAVTRDQYSVVGQAVYSTMLQGFLYRIFRRLPGFLVDDMKNLFHRAADGFRFLPAGKLFGNGIQERHAPLGISGHDCIPDGVERNRELFLADMQDCIGLLELFIRIEIR